MEQHCSGSVHHRQELASARPQPMLTHTDSVPCGCASKLSSSLLIGIMVYTLLYSMDYYLSLMVMMSRVLMPALSQGWH